MGLLRGDLVSAPNVSDAASVTTHHPLTDLQHLEHPFQIRQLGPPLLLFPQKLDLLDDPLRFRRLGSFQDRMERLDRLWLGTGKLRSTKREGTYDSFTYHLEIGDRRLFVAVVLFGIAPILRLLPVLFLLGGGYRSGLCFLPRLA